ncbi:hypothetical protein BIY24_16140 [Halobacteriovorax marinus]|uniref:Exported protein n=1 Tax=Halobacteriovorax marinus (strain ATCC BAA-682 / DSM 15412 / SJ) TaxID=862908 RepID=E1X184_HALMS|nr:hypothetical protein [Halobacteriovorax marinus]ATH09414.1 hypothetical protein BIY24_16140 [Halobacteriovorax marinus]CBW28154.1 putative exported protein [Halobacteriovorax marinus SJ]
MRKLLSLALFFTTLNIYAVAPSVEGLFRNPNSQDLDGNLIVLKAMIEREATEEEYFKPSFYKFIFSIEAEQRVKFLQVEYSEGKMSNDEVVSTLFLNNFFPKVKNDELIERSLFYSLLTMYGLNSSEAISSILKRYSMNYISNKDSLNKEKLDLFDKYKKYLTAVKENEDIKEELTSPLEGEDEEAKKKIQEIRSSSMYSENKALKLVKEGRNFFLNLDLGGVSAKFTNEEHRLVRMKVSKGTSDVESFFSDYILFNGRHELPKHIMIKDQSNINYNVRFLGLSIFNNTGDDLAKRALRYKKIEEENLAKNPKKDLMSQEEPVANAKGQKLITQKPVLVY